MDKSQKIKKWKGRNWDENTQAYHFSDNSAPPITFEQKEAGL